MYKKHETRKKTNIYFFQQQIANNKFSAPTHSQPQMFPPSYYQPQQSSPYHPRPLMQNMMHTPAKKIIMGGVVTPNPRSSSERKRKRGTGHSTGYIIFAAHAHPKVRAENPGLKFGEISRVVNIFTLIKIKTLCLSLIY